MRLALLLVPLVAVSCKWLAPPPPPTAAPPPDLAAARPPDLAGPPALAHVQLRGTVAAAGLPAGPILVVLSDGPCFAAGTHYVATGLVKAGAAYRLDAFPPVGSTLDLCAALVVQGRRKTPFFARAAKAPLILAGRAGVTLDGVDIALRRGPPINVPEGLRLE